MDGRLRLGALGAACVLALYGCVQPPPKPPEIAAGYMVGEPYQEDGVWFYPREEWSYDETGLATVYPAKHRFTHTTNGEPFDPNALTAGHPTLQLPALARVTNLANGRSVVVRVNDRGPGKAGRLMELTGRAADLLGIGRDDQAPVRVTLLADESRIVAATAQRGGGQLARLPTEPTEVVPVAAPRPAVQIDGQTPSEPQAREPHRVPTAPTGVAGKVAADGRFLPDPEVTQVPVRGNPAIYVEAGPFSQFNDANRVRARISDLGRSDVQQTAAGRAPSFTVRVGPMPSVDHADQALARLRSQGQPNARIVVQ
ncbi:MAG TPA: RlpA-like double-psi beta-barrel domain-containing protein [Azospirillaceae bacterium]|nr:RlpA-like double-psi beta-barrel domain-containing protein [Azospirillaceae bacterium]